MKTFAIDTLERCTKAALATVALASLSLAVGATAKAETVGNFDEGAQVGARNGTLMAERIYARTIGVRDCAGLAQFQQVAALVAARARPGHGASTAFTAGFYHGYARALTGAVRNAKAACGLARFDDGLYPGAFYGNLYCQVASVDAAALAQIPFGPIYDDWAENVEVKRGCAAAFSVVTEECGLTGIAAQLLGATQEAVCQVSAQ